MRHERKTVSVILRYCMIALFVLFMTLVALAPGVESAQGNGLVLTDAEQTWLARHPVVRIPLNEEYPPFHMLKA